MCVSVYVCVEVSGSGCYYQGGRVVPFLTGSYGKSDITKLGVDSFPEEHLILFCH